MHAQGLSAAETRRPPEPARESVAALTLNGSAAPTPPPRLPTVAEMTLSDFPA